MKQTPHSSPGEPTDPENPPKIRAWLAPALLAAFALIAYYASFSGRFFMDDERHILNNPYIRSLWPPWMSMFSRLNFARPITGLSFAINYAISATHPWSYHVVNGMIHMGTAYALFLLLKRMLNEKIALTVSLLWVVHPINVQAVTYVTQRFQSLMALAYVLVLYFAWRAFESTEPRRWYRCTVWACGLGMLCKEDMIGAPLVVLVMDVLFFSGSWKKSLQERKHFYGALAATGLLPLVLHLLGPQLYFAGFQPSLPSPWEYFLTQLTVWPHYALSTFWPNGLSFDYGWPTVRSLSEVEAHVLIFVAALGGVGAALYYKKKWAFIPLFIAVTLAPSSSVLPIADAAWDYRMYLPTMALLTGSVILIQRLGTWRIPVVLVALGAFTWITIQTNRLYQDEISLWSSVIKQRPQNPRGWMNLGVAYDRKGAKEQAEGFFVQTLRLRPDYPPALVEMGRIRLLQSKTDEALGLLMMATTKSPPFAVAHSLLAQAFEQKGNAAAALKEYTTALSLNPDLVEALNNLGNLLLKHGKSQEAFIYLKRALWLNPNSGDIHYNIGNAFRITRQFDLAQVSYETALKINPTDNAARNNLGAIFYDSSRKEAAMEQFETSLKYNPKDFTALVNAAQTSLSLGQTAKAAQYAERALQLVPKNSLAMSILSKTKPQKSSGRAKKTSKRK